MDSTVNLPLKKVRREQRFNRDCNINGSELSTVSGSLKLTDEHKQQEEKVFLKHGRKKRSPAGSKAVKNTNENRKSKMKDKKLKTDSQTELQSDFYPDPTLAGHMEDLREDIIQYSEPFQSPVKPVNQTAINSPNKLYLQCTYGFKEINTISLSDKKDVSGNRKIENEDTTPDYSHLPASVALNSQRAFLILSTICQGLLAGLVLWHCLMVYFLRHSSLSVDDYYQHYSFMAYPGQAIIYFLLAVSLLSVLDRCDVGNSLKGFFYSFIFLNPIVYLVILYTVAFILSLAIKKTEDKIVLKILYKNKTNFDESYFKIKEEEYREWWILNVVRTVILIFNWILICIIPDNCQLTSHIKEIL